MDNPGPSLARPKNPPSIQPLEPMDLALIERVREELVQRGINPPGWRETDPSVRQRSFDEVRSILIDWNTPAHSAGGQGENPSSVNRKAQIITDALSSVELLDQLLRDPYVEEIFVRNGDVAVEYDGTFYHLGKLAADRYFENLAIHVADQGGATLRGDRPAVLIDLPGGERFTAIVPRLSTEGTAINIRTFGRRVRTLEEMEQSGAFSRFDRTPLDTTQNFASGSQNHATRQLQKRVQSLQNPPDRFLAWLVSTLSGTLMIAGEMGSGKTTLLNALSGFLPESAPIAALETFREIEIQHPFLLRAVAPAELSPGTPGVTLDWILNVIYTRMNPADAQASQRRRRSNESKRKIGNIRAAVEATVRNVKLPFPEAQLPVRGKFRVTCMLIGSATIANVRRIQRYLQAIFQEELRQNKVQDLRDSASDALAPSFLVSARTIFARFLRFRSVFGRGFIV